MAFGTVINCMDGRVQVPVAKWMKKKYHLEYIDTITEAGADKVVVEGGEELLERIKSKLNISVNKHGSRIIGVVGHCDCGGNPTSNEEHLKQIKECVKVISSWNFPVKKIIGLWVNDKWEVEKIVEE